MTTPRAPAASIAREALGAARRADDLVTRGHEQRHQPGSDGARGAGDEDSHVHRPLPSLTPSDGWAPAPVTP